MVLAPSVWSPFGSAEMRESEASRSRIWPHVLTLVACASAIAAQVMAPIPSRLALLSVMIGFLAGGIGIAAKALGGGEQMLLGFVMLGVMLFGVRWLVAELPARLAGRWEVPLLLVVASSLLVGTLLLLLRRRSEGRSHADPSS